jgi:uncharacterized membrane protein
MADEQNVAQAPPAEPKPLAPRREAVVDGSAVTFEWEGVDGADSYHLQVATDNHLHDLVYEQDLEATEHTAEDVFETDGATYFWSVEARNDAGWSDEEYVESFVSGTAEDVEAVAASPEPNDEEDYGPAGELVRAAAAEMAAEATGSEAYFEAERERGVAHEGIEAGQIMSIALGIIAVIVLLVVVLFVMFGLSEQRQQRAVRETSRYTELKETEAQAADKLDQYAIINDQEDVYRIPIDQAMDNMVNEAYRQEKQAK